MQSMLLLVLLLQLEGRQIDYHSDESFLRDGGIFIFFHFILKFCNW